MTATACTAHSGICTIKHAEYGRHCSNVVVRKQTGVPKMCARTKKLLSVPLCMSNVSRICKTRTSIVKIPEESVSILGEAHKNLNKLLHPQPCVDSIFATAVGVATPALPQASPLTARGTLTDPKGRKNKLGRKRMRLLSLLLLL